MEKALIAALWILSVLASGFVGFIAAYLKKKGENLATHEDIGKVVDQVRAVTTTAKEIEAKISTEVWDRQKRWEMKRDVLFEATKRLTALEDALLALHTTRLAEKIHRKPDEPEWFEAKAQSAKKWDEASGKFEETGLLISIVCGKDIKEASDSLRLFTRQIASEILKNEETIYIKSQQELIQKSVNMARAIRRELGTDESK
jgi:hypothetical protein